MGRLVESGRRRLSIGTQFRILVGLLASLLVGICGIVVLDVHAIRTDLRRAAEERREAEQAHALLLDLRGFERVVRLCANRTRDGDDLARDDQAGHLRGAAHALDELSRVVPDDPSELAHEREEERQRSSLRLHIDAGLAATAHQPVGAEWEERAAQMRRLAEELDREVADEARAATRDLERRGGAMIHFVTVLALAGLLLLLVVCAWVARGLVQPLRDLAEGTRAIGRGRRDRILPSHGGAEIVELASEITAMAQELDSHQVELRNRVEQRTRELVRSARLAHLGTVAAGLAHEINTPLASIVACAEGLQRRVEHGRVDPEEQQDYLRTIAQEADRVRDMTARLLEMARPESAELGPVDAIDAVRAAITLSRHRFLQKGVHLLDASDAELPPVRGRGEELRQVLLNLLGNALDASEPGARVVVRAHRVGSEIVIDVDDEGAGVPAELADRIFDPFFTTKEVGKGTGLGLAIVQRIVERHGGHVELTALDPGTRFRLRLPIGVE